MNDVDRLSPAEQRLRAELRRALVPPATPLSLAARVDDLAAAAREASGHRRSWRMVMVAGGRTLRVGLALAALLLLVVAAGLLVGSSREPAEVATPHPTVPALVGPALPSPAAQPTLLREGAWIDADTAWLIDDAANLRITTDGGQTWSEPRPLPPDIATLSGYEFLDADHGYLTSTDPIGQTGSLRTWRTTDGGRSWQSSSLGPLVQAANEQLQAQVHYTDRRHAIAMVATVVDSQQAFQSCGPGFSSDDGGASWTAQPAAPCPVPVWWAGTTGVAQADTRTGTIFTTNDGGRSWVPAIVPGTGNGVEFWPRALVPVGSGQARLAGTYFSDGIVGAPPVITLETDDSGGTWHETWRASLLDDAQLQWLTAFDADHWLALGSSVSLDRPFQSTGIQETWDGGRTWEQAPGTGTIDASWASWGDRLHGMIQGVDMSDCVQSDGACGGTGTIFLTNDGGRTWHEVPF